MNDFSPEVRNSAWWSGDSRRAWNGRALDAILEKQGKKPIADLSDVEEVQMGKEMQPYIARMWQSRFGKELKDADYSITHSKHSWMRSHFDYITADGRELVEIKNYNLAAQSKFSNDDETPRVPAADMAQLIHEAACHGVETIHLCVLFGGQRFRNFQFWVSESQKEELIKDMAQFWGHVQANTTPEPTTIEQCKILFSTDDGKSIVASKHIAALCEVAKQANSQIKEMQAKLDDVEAEIRAYMGNKAELLTVEGLCLATWKSAKSSKRFDPALFKDAMPEVYEQFIREVPGSRRFLLKG